MKDSLKRAWVTALRSGFYEQGHGCLCMDGKFCCLGVLADVAGDIRDTSPLTGFLPSHLREAHGLGYASESMCVKWNDTQRLSFREIADKIEGGELDGMPQRPRRDDV